MSKIGIIATSQLMLESATDVVSELGMEEKAVLRLEVGDMEGSLPLAREFAASGVEVIVTRGATCEIIRRSDVQIPLVEIPVGMEEFFAAVAEAKKVCGKSEPRIGIMAFVSMTYALTVFSKLSGVDLRIYNITPRGNHFEALVREGLRDNIDVMLGGEYGAGIARRMGLPGVVLGSSHESIRMALREAERVAVSHRLDQARIRRLQLVLDLFPYGVIAVDRDRRVQLANPSACRLLGVSRDIIGAPVGEILPSLDVEASLHQGEAHSNRLFACNGVSLVAGIWPVLLANEVTGAVITLQAAEHIRNLDKKISDELYVKGLIAQRNFSDIAAHSPAMKDALKKAKRYAVTNGTVLILGETGTGKELFAQSIHNASPFRHGPFVAVNCAALPPSLVESELFGYEEGAFTGAGRKGKPGFFELANNGTIFLDEISEMDSYGQTRLLRVLQEKRSIRLGGGRYVQLNVRVVAASNRDLRILAEQGGFRRDLYYRLGALTLRLPPLRRRKEDIPFLLESFATAILGKVKDEPYFTPDALAYLLEYAWPGNVREMQNIVERLCLFYENRTFGLDAVREAIEYDVVDEADAFSEGGIIPSSFPKQRQYEELLEALDKAGGNQQLAAKLLGIHPSTLYRRMRRHQVKKGYSKKRLQ